MYNTVRLSPKEKLKANINLVLCIIAAILFATILIMVGTETRLYRIIGHSMNPTLYENNLVLTKHQKEYTRGDIIAFRKDGSTTIKRLIGLPGDEIFIDLDGKVSVNGKELDEPYVLLHQMHPSEIEFPITVPENKYFVLGDNRSNSRDSREKSFGYVDKDEVIGKVIKSLIPLKNIK